MSTEGEQFAIVALLSGKAEFVRFQSGPDLGGKAQDFKPGDPVWLGLDCNIVCPFTGKRAVHVESIVLTVIGAGVQIITVRGRLQGAVPAARLCKRKPGEIMPGRKDFRPFTDRDG